MHLHNNLKGYSIMEINTNNAPINQSQSQLRVTAHKARLENKKVLNESLKTLHDDVKSISNTEALKYLQSKSNIRKANDYSISYDNETSNISRLSKELNNIRHSIAKYGSSTNTSDAKAKATKQTELMVGLSEIELQETAYNKNTFTRSYTSKEESIDLGDYQIRDLKLAVELDEENKQVLNAEAKIDLSSQEFGLTLAQTFDNENVFIFEDDAKIEINSNVYLEKLILADSSLNYTAQTTDNKEIATNDDELVQALQSLEKQYGKFATGTTDTLVASAKENKTTILEEFKNFVDQQEDNENLKQDILQLRIDSIQSQDRPTQGITGILLNII